MNKFLLISSLLFCVLVLRVCSAKRTLKFEENTFKKLNKQIQNVFNEIFLMLKLDQNFTRSDENKLLLSMHANMKTISERNSQYYRYVKLLCKLAKKKHGKELFNLDKLIDVLVSERLIPNNDSQNLTQTKRSGLNLKLTSLEMPEKFEESIIFLREYLYTVEGLTLVGFESPSDKIKDLYEKNTRRLKNRRKNLKTWEDSNKTDEDLTPNTRRVFKGKVGRINHYPFLASIHVMGDFTCTGSIIHKDIVLTAASCLHIAYKNQFLQQNHDGIAVRIGSDYTQKFGELCNALRIHFHPDYDPATLRNNLAIIKIEKRFQYLSSEKIRRIRYATTSSLPNSTKDILMLGWGSEVTHYPNAKLEMLTYSVLDVYDLQRCIDVYSDLYVHYNNFCGGFIKKGSGACKRDVGGPGIVDSVLVGIVSFGPPVCGTADAPTVFTAVGEYFDWIESVAAEDFDPPTTTKPKTKKMFPKRIKGNRHVVSSLRADTIPFTNKQSEQKTNQTQKTGLSEYVSDHPNALQFLSKFLDELFSKTQTTWPTRYKMIKPIASKRNSHLDDKLQLKDDETVEPYISENPTLREKGNFFIIDTETETTSNPFYEAFKKIEEFMGFQTEESSTVMVTPATDANRVLGIEPILPRKEKSPKVNSKALTKLHSQKQYDFNEMDSNNYESDSNGGMDIEVITNVPIITYTTAEVEKFYEEPKAFENSANDENPNEKDIVLDKVVFLLKEKPKHENKISFHVDSNYKNLEGITIKNNTQNSNERNTAEVEIETSSEEFIKVGVENPRRLLQYIEV